MRLQTKHLLGRVPNVDLSYSAEDEAFRAEVRDVARGAPDRRVRRAQGPRRPGQGARGVRRSGWPGTGTSPRTAGPASAGPTEHGGRGLSLWQQVIFHEEYARADAPARVNHLGEELLGPTLIAFGTEEQQERFLPKILAVEELWAQGYSEPGAGSDLANVQTKARLDGDEWVVDGQKVWTSNAHFCQWFFVIARTEPGLRAAPRAVVPAGADRPGRRRGPADRAAHRRLGVQRGVLHRRPHRRRPGRRRARRRLAGRDGAARLRARRLDPGPAGRLRPRARRRRRAWRRRTARSTTRCCATGWRRSRPSSR